MCKGERAIEFYKHLLFSKFQKFESKVKNENAHKLLFLGHIVLTQPGLSNFTSGQADNTFLVSNAKRAQNVSKLQKLQNATLYKRRYTILHSTCSNI